MKTSTIVFLLLLSISIIPAQAQLKAPEIKVETTMNNRVEFRSDLHLLNSNTTAYIKTSGEALVKKLTVTHNGDNSAMRFQTADPNKKGAIGIQDDGDDGLYVAVNGSYRLHVNMNGNVAIGRTIASERLHINGNILASNVSVTSDEKLKQNIQEYNGGLALVKQIKPKKYKYKPRKEQRIKEPTEGEEDGDEVVEEEILVADDREYIGVVAQELKAVAPDLVGSFKDEDGSETLTVDQTALIFVLINSVKELSKEVEELRSAIKTKSEVKEKLR